MSDNDPGDLGARIAKAKAAHEASEKAAHQPKANDATKPAGMALRYSTELVFCVLVGAGIGVAIDHFAGTRPFGLLVFMGFGIAAGFRNVLRAARKMTEESVKAADAAAEADEKKSE